MPKQKTKAYKKQMKGAGKDLLHLVDLFSKGKNNKIKEVGSAVLNKVADLPAVFIHDLSKAKKKHDEILRRLATRKVGGGPKVKKFFNDITNWVKGHIKAKPLTIAKKILHVSDKIIDVAAALNIPTAGTIKTVKDFTKSIIKGDHNEIVDAARDVIELGKKIAKTRNSKKAASTVSKLSRVVPDIHPISELIDETGVFMDTKGNGLKLAGQGLFLPGGSKPCASGAYSGSGEMKTKGTKKEVWNGLAKKTSGGLTKNDLMKNKRGKIISKKMYAKGQELAKKYGIKKK